MKIKATSRFINAWNRFTDQTVEFFGQRQVLKNADKLEYLEKVLLQNPNYGFPEPYLSHLKIHEYRSLLFVGSYKIVYYVTSKTIYLADFWNMRMSPSRLTKPYNIQK